jgi:hypothetical protein
LVHLFCELMFLKRWQVILDKLKRGFQLHYHLNQRLFWCLQTSGKFSHHLAKRLLRCLLGLSIDQVTNGFSLSEINFSVTECPQGELAWASQSCS